MDGGCFGLKIANTIFNFNVSVVKIAFFGGGGGGGGYDASQQAASCY